MEDLNLPSSSREPFAHSLLSRRRFLRHAAVVGASVPVISALLAACGGNSDKTATSGSSAATTSSGGATTPTPAITINQNASPVASSGTPAATMASAGKAGGSVTFSRGYDALNADPTVWHNPDIWVFLSVYQPIVAVKDNGLELAPSLAEKWDVSDDGLTYTFNIRQGVKFSDGSDLTVEDITWTLERARTDEKGGWNFTLMQVKEIKAADDETVVITLTGVWAPFLSDLSMFNAGILSKAFVDKNGVDYLAEHALGTGPFFLKEWKKGVQIVLGKNEHYWEKDRPFLDEVVLKQIPDTNSQILQLQGGETHGIIGQSDVPLNRVPDLDKDDKLKVYRFTSTFNNFVVLNCRNAPLNDVKLRQALNYATDKKSLIDTFLFGNAEISNSFMPNGMLFWNPDQTPYAFDLDKANELMKASNSPNGAKIELLIRSGSESAMQTATALKEMWSKINVELSLLQLEAAVARDNYNHNKFETNLSGWTNDIIDPDELISYAILPESNENYHTGWTNKQAIDLAHQAQTELDPEKRRQIYYQVQQIHKDDAPFVYLYVIPYVDVLSVKVKDFFHHPMGQYVFTNTYLES